VKLSTATVVLAIGLLAGCGSSRPQAGGSRPATLRVKQVMVPGSLYFEGSYSYVRVEREGREVAKSSSRIREPSCVSTKGRTA
jgi:hypothetical protein